jgi:hypothetical protein
MNLPIYRLLINDEETSGVEYVALVDDPAIMKNWVAFNSHKFESYNDYPKAAKENAQRAIDLREKHDLKCGTPVGWQRANQLAKGENISRDTIARMAAFERHRENSKGDPKEDCGALMWLAWGGDEGITWAQRKLEQIDRQDFVKPSKGERESEFIPRCISTLVDEGKEQEQAAAICYSVWKEEHKSSMQIHDEEKRVIAGPLMIADLPIYRQDEKLGEYYVVFDSKTIEQICLKYHYQQNNKNVNLMHDPNQKVQGVFMFNDFIINRKLGVNPPKGYESLPDGSWFGFYKVENPEVWNKVKDGEIRGFSVEGIFEHQFIVDKDATQIEALMERFKSLRSKLANIK